MFTEFIVELLNLDRVVVTVMAEKILYMVVVDESVKLKENEKESFRYTRPVLQSTLQLMGCKARHAFKVQILFHHFVYYANYIVYFQFHCGLFMIVLCLFIDR